MAQEPDFFCREVTAARRFYLDLRPRAAAGLVVACGGWELCTSDYRVCRSGFPWIGLELVVEGAGRLTLAGREHRLVPGAVFTYGPGIAHDIASDQRRPLRKYFIDLGGDDALPLFRGAGMAPGTMARLPVPARARAMLDLLIDAGSAGGGQAPAICAALASAMVLTIGTAAVDPRRVEEPAYATYLRCRRHLEEHADGTATLGAAAKRLGISSAYLCRLFRRYDLESPWRLVRQRRLQSGAELLADPSLRVADVAERLGYADPSHFSRAFSQAFSISPQRFRRLGR